MKTKFCMLAVIALLMYCCQKKDWTDPNENEIEIDSAEISGINDNLLRKWFSLNRESDSIIKDAQLLIDQRREQVEFHPQDEREYINTCIEEAQLRLDLLKKKVKFTKEFAAGIKHYEPSLQYTIDSLEEDYVREKYKLEDALRQLR
jgi:site-specific DNA-adenine methylase